MNVGLVFSHADLTGAPRMGVAHARAFLEAGDRVVALAGPSPAGEASAADALAALGVPVTREEGFEGGAALALAARAARWARAERLDLVVGIQQATVKVAGPAARAAGAAFVYCAMAHPEFHGRTATRRLKHAAFVTYLRTFADLVVAVSDAIADELVLLRAVAGGRVRVVPTGIELEPFVALDPAASRAARLAHGVEEDELLVVSLGRLEPVKGQDVLLEALERLRHLPRWRAVIAGGVSIAASEASREFARRLAERAATFGGRVKLAGWVEHIRPLLAAADVFVHPSRAEGAPLAVLEAMAAGRVIVTTDCAGRPAGFVDGQHGWVVARDDPVALAAGLERALALDPAARARAGERCRALAQGFDVRTSAARVVALAREAAGPSRRGRDPGVSAGPGLP